MEQYTAEIWTFPRLGPWPTQSIGHFFSHKEPVKILFTCSVGRANRRLDAKYHIELAISEKVLVYTRYEMIALAKAIQCAVLAQLPEFAVLAPSLDPAYIDVSGSDV